MKKTTMGAWLVLAAMAMFGVGCTVPVQTSQPGGNKSTSNANNGGLDDPSVDPNNPDGANGANTSSDTPVSQGQQGVDANTKYVPETDQTKAGEIIKRMWATLTSKRCWYRQNTIDNYSFFNYDEFRDTTYEISTGHITPLSAGKFGPYDTAEATFGRRERWVVIIDSETIAISFLHEGKFVVNYYFAVKGNDVCV